MKKVLLIGELNQTVSNLNNYLIDYYYTQVCTANAELVQGMTKVINPSIAIICLVGMEQLDVKILDFFREEKPDVPVLLIGTGEECRQYKQYFSEDQFDFILRPTNQTVLLEKCSEKLKTKGRDGEEEIVPVQPVKRRIKHILIVDDSAVSLRSIKSILDKKYDITVTMSGEKAVPLAKKLLPDLILLDYDMPGWNGKKTLEKIRNEEDIMDIPVMFLTGVSDKEHISAVLGLNPAGYLLKPIDQKKLLDMIEDLIGE